MLTKFVVISILAIDLIVGGAGNAFGQRYPTRPIRILTSGVGGSGDIVARLLAQGLTPSLGQQVIVDNRASGTIPGEIVAKAPPDGYTLLLSSGLLWIGPLLHEVPYDPIRDFSPITLVANTPTILVVHPSVSANTVKELVALAKAKPGQLNYGSTGLGASTHLAGELFKAMANVNVVRINYKGLGLAMNDLIGGQLQLMFVTPSSVASQIKSGRVKALAVTSERPSSLAPDLPTVAESGLPGYEAVATHGFFAPAKMPASLIDRLNREVVMVLNRVDFKERFLAAGVETVGNSPLEFAAKMKSEMVRMGKVIQNTGIRAD